MFKVIFYIIISIFIVAIAFLLYISVSNIILNYKIKHRQTRKNINLFSFSFLKQIILVLFISVLAITFTLNRSRIYSALYFPGPTRGECMILGDETFTPEGELNFFNYIAVISSLNHADTIMFDILEEDGIPIPYKTDVYTYEEVVKSRGEYKADFLYDKYYFGKVNDYITDGCDDPALGLQEDKVYVVFGRYVEDDIELKTYENSILLFKAVELKNYDVNKSVEEQTQEIIDLLDALGYFVEVKNQ